jgi:hypothetical protein
MPSWQEDEVVEAPAWGWQHDEVVSTEPPSSLAVAGTSAAKSVASFIDMFPNAPINAWNLSKAVTGYVAEQAGYPEVLAETTITPTPDPARKLLTAIGAIRPENEPQTSAQRILDMAVQAGVGTALSPASGVAGVAKNVALGAVSGTAAGLTKEATGSDLAATAVGMAVPLATAAYGAYSARASAPTRTNPVKRATLQDALDEGYVVPPSTVKPSFATNRLESFGGKAAVKQEAAIRNQQVTNRLAAEEIGLPGDTVLTESILKQVRDEAGTVYQDIAAISPRASSALENLKQTRFDAKEQWNYYARTGNPEAGTLARSLSAKSELYERAIAREAKQLTAKRPAIVDELREARTRIAKTYDIEKALNLGSGDVDAHVIGRLLDKGGIASKSGNLRIIGKFAEAFRDATREGARVPAAGVSALDASMAIGLGTAGYLGTGGPEGLALAAIPSLRGPVRSAMLSGLYQQRLLKEPPSLNQAMLKSILAGRAIEDAAAER